MREEECGKRKRYEQRKEGKQARGRRKKRLIASGVKGRKTRWKVK